MKLIVAVAAFAALGGALPDNLGSLRRWGASNIVGRQDPPLAPLAGKQEEKETPKYEVPTTNGCYKSPGELKLKQGKITNNSEGLCGEMCAAEGFVAAGSMGGMDCYCGDTYPPEEDLVENDNCNVPCSGWGSNACGGIGFWTIYNTGVELLVEHAKPKESSTSTSSTSTTKPTSTETAPEKTQATTEAASEEGENVSDDDGPNVAGIVAGVVVGVVVIAAALGGGFLYMRRKRNKEIEEEHRRNAAVNAFIGKAPSSSGGSITDARLDPVMAHRRMSDGSIADNHDYSRKILRVTNA